MGEPEVPPGMGSCEPLSGAWSEGAQAAKNATLFPPACPPGSLLCGVPVVGRGRSPDTPPNPARLEPHAELWGVAARDSPPGPQELFKKVVPYHCLGSIWSQRDKKGKEHLAPTVRATVTQFNNVANCVITTCLGDWSVTARDRARVVEHWIEVARVRLRGGLGEPLSHFIWPQGGGLWSRAPQRPRPSFPGALRPAHPAARVISPP